MRYNLIGKEQFAKSLDSMAKGGSLRTIAKQAGVSYSTIQTLLKEYPLWNWRRDHPIKDDE